MEKYLRDAHDDKEMALSKEIFDMYMESNDIGEFNKLVSKKSNEINKTLTYLKGLRNVYVDNYATMEEKIMHSIKKGSMKNSVPNFVKFFDDLFSISPKKRFNYLQIKGVTPGVVKENFEKYKNYGGKYIDIIDDFYKDYSLFIVKDKYKKKDAKARIEYKKACQFFDEIINLGCYSITDYLDYLNTNKRRIDNVAINSLRRKIVNRDSQKWQCYLYKMERNRINTYLLLKDRINEFKEKMVNGYLNEQFVDVIDYYTIVGIPFKKFKEICSGHLTPSEMSLFNAFITPYVNMDEKYFSDESYSKINYRSYETDALVTDEEKLCIIDFLRKNNVPVAYFPVALGKYLKGDLDIKYKSLKKEI